MNISAIIFTIIATIVVLYLIRKLRINKARLTTNILAVAAVTITISMLLYPDIAFAAAKRGLEVWWNKVFPALLPFFIGAEILMGLGVVRFMGTLLEPLMRPLFNVPGEGSFVMAMGLASGYPIGAILTSKLRRQKICNQTEAERLISFTNTADPLFMFGVVAVGMFHDPKLGAIIAAGHYLSSVCVGLTMRFYRRKAPITKRTDTRTENLFVRAFRALYRAREQDGRPFGQILGDSVKQSVNSLLMVGGFIIFFSVIIQIATVAGLVQAISGVFASLFASLGIASNLSGAATSGLFEITIGAQLTSEAIAPLGHKMMLAGAIIAWSGLSVHAQVAAVSNDTDIRLGPYILARAWHAVLAGVFTILIFNYGNSLAQHVSLPIFYATGNLGWFYSMTHGIYAGCWTLLITLGIGFTIGIIHELKQAVVTH